MLLKTQGTAELNLGELSQMKTSDHSYRFAFSVGIYPHHSPPPPPPPPPPHIITS